MNGNLVKILLNVKHERIYMLHIDYINEFG